MGYATTIMTREEAMKLPLKKRPICFRISGEIYTAVFEAIGSASMCWKPNPRDHTFDSEIASKIAVDLCFKIAEELESYKCPQCGYLTEDKTNLKQKPTNKKKTKKKK